MVKITKSLVSSIEKDPEAVLKTLTVDDIAELIQKANHDYYNKDTPLFSDQIFDIIKEFLASIQPEHPVLKYVGANVAKVNKVALPYYMGSLDKVKNEQKVLDNWIKRYDGPYVLSDKLDGNSGLLMYANGELKLYSRGNGTHGQDLTHLIPFLKTKFALDDFQRLGNKIAIRGELIINKSDFTYISSENKNARNTVAGLINAKIPDLKIASITSFIAYEVLEPPLKPSEQFTFIKNKLKMKYAFYQVTPKLTMDGLSDFLESRRKHSEYEIDGIVVTNDAIYPRQTSNPEYSFAFKSIFTMEKAEVNVLKVEWNMSKDGIYVPVVHFTPVQLDGVVISKAHGFNGKYIVDNVIGPGAVIVIMRSGAVIPYIVETIVQASQPQLPDVPFVWSKSGVDIMFDVNNASSHSNDKLKLKNVEYFFEKIDVRGLSSGIVARLFEHGFNTVGKILHIAKKDLLQVEGFQDTLAEKIVKAIESKKDSIDPYLVLDASNTLGRGIGYKKIKLICDTYPDIIQERHIPSLIQLTSIKGIELKTAELFIKNLPLAFAFVDDNGLSLVKVDKNSDAPSTSQASISPSSVSKVKDRTYVFSGVRDKDLKTFIEKHGGHVTGTVSSKTTIVIVKDLEFESSKTTKAKALGIPVMTIDDFKNDIMK